MNEDKFAEIIVRLSTLLRFATEIKEMDINPLLATEKQVIAVDARIRIERSRKYCGSKSPLSSEIEGDRTNLSFIGTHFYRSLAKWPIFEV